MQPDSPPDALTRVNDQTTDERNIKLLVLLLNTGVFMRDLNTSRNNGVYTEAMECTAAYMNFLRDNHNDGSALMADVIAMASDLGYTLNLYESKGLVN